MARNKPPFGMQAMLRLERGTASAIETLRRYAPLADEIGADGIDVDDERADLLLSGSLVAVSEERARHAMAGPLLHRFGWREQDFVYSPNVRYAETLVPPSGPPATRLVIDRADQEMGWEGATHGTGRTPDRTLGIGPAETDIVGRLFVAVPATPSPEQWRRWSRGCPASSPAAPAWIRAGPPWCMSPTAAYGPRRNGSVQARSRPAASRATPTTSSRLRPPPTARPSGYAAAPTPSTGTGPALSRSRKWRPPNTFWTNRGALPRPVRPSDT